MHLGLPATMCDSMRAHDDSIFVCSAVGDVVRAANASPLACCSWSVFPAACCATHVEPVAVFSKHGDILSDAPASVAGPCESGRSHAPMAPPHEHHQISPCTKADTPRQSSISSGNSCRDIFYFPERRSKSTAVYCVKRHDCTKSRAEASFSAQEVTRYLL